MRGVILVTGGAKRIGREIALACARAGWRVAIHHRDSRAEAKATQIACAAAFPFKTAAEEDATSRGVAARAAKKKDAAAALVFPCDLADTKAVQDLVPTVVRTMGRLDAVINSAALFSFDDAAKFDPALFDAHQAINARAPIQLALSLLGHLKAKRRRGVVINLLDQKLWNPNPDFLSYTLSKATLHAATDLLARAAAPTVRFVGVAPGLTLASNLMNKKQFAKLHRLSPLGKSSTTADITQAVLFALDNPAITGTTLLVDGGQHLQAFSQDFSRMT